MPPTTTPDTAAMYKALMFAQTALIPVGSGASIKALSLIDGILNASPVAPATAGEATAAPPAPKKMGYCKDKAQPGGCQKHNLFCGYPKCDEAPGNGEGGK